MQMLNELPCRGVGGQIVWAFTSSYLGHKFNSHSVCSSDPKRNTLENVAVYFYPFCYYRICKCEMNSSAEVLVAKLVGCSPVII